MKDRIEKAKAWIKEHQSVVTVAGVGAVVAAGALLFKENFSKEKRYPFSYGDYPKPTLEDYEAELLEIEEMRSYVQDEIDAIKSS